MKVPSGICKNAQCGNTRENNNNTASHGCSLGETALGHFYSSNTEFLISDGPQLGNE